MKIADRDALVAALKDAAELEHQLMLQYLYTGFSLKRGPDATCSPAQYEMARRWSSTLFMVARQEMEHLSLANGMLTAIGAPVHFARPNIVKQGLLSPYFASAALADGLSAGAPEPVSLPYAYDRFDLSTVGRFVCGESPPWDAFPDKAKAPPWCFTHGPTQPAAAGPEPLRLDPWLAPGDEPGVAAGTVQGLYEAIRRAFVELPGLFVAGPPEVVIPVEYNVFVFPVTDQRSALGAIDIILEQGEGLGDPWNLDSHFRRFCEIRTELEFWGDRVINKLGFRLEWELDVNGPQTIHGDLGGRADCGQPWHVRLWCGGWDGDLLLGYLRGALSMPFEPDPTPA